MRRVSVLSQRAGLLLWQVKLIARAVYFQHSLSRSLSETTAPVEEHVGAQPSLLISAEQALSLNKRLELLTDTWLEGWYPVFFFLTLTIGRVDNFHSDFPETRRYNLMGFIGNMELYNFHADAMVSDVM